MRRGDITAGLAVAGLLLPEAVAYAGIAGLAPARAIVAAIAGTLVYALVGRSRFAIVAPTSSSAAILAAALAAMPGDPATRAMMATLAVAMAGLLFLVAGTARLGGLTGFIARPVLQGLAFGLAITIVLRQVPAIVGVSMPGSNIFALAGKLVLSVPEWNAASTALGIATGVALLLLRRYPAIPGALLVLALGIATSAIFHLGDHGVSTIGVIEPSFSIPAVHVPTSSMLLRLAQMVVPLALILFAESWGTMRALALRHGDILHPDRELSALGFANLAAAAVQGMPVGAGFSAGTASEAAGAASRLTSAVAGIGLAVFFAFGGPLMAFLPRPVLAAVVIAALAHPLDPAPLLRLWRLRRDHLIGFGAAIGVILLGVLNGMLFAVALSIAAMIRRTASPQLVELGRLAAGHNYVAVARHPEAHRIAGLAIWRAAEPLFFANAERVFESLERRVAAARSISALVFSLEESFDIDSTALDALIEFDGRLAKRGLTLRLARVHDPVRDLLIASGASDLVARSSYSVDDAVRMALDHPGFRVGLPKNR